MGAAASARGLPLVICMLLLPKRIMETPLGHLSNHLCRALDAPEAHMVCAALRRHGALIVGPAALHIYMCSKASSFPFRTLDFFVESKACCSFLGDILENHPEMEQHSTTDIAGHAASLAVPPLHVWARGVTRTHTLFRRGKITWIVYVLDCSPAARRRAARARPLGLRF